MARHIDPESVSSKVSELKTNETIDFNNPPTSVAVMVSILRKKKKHSNKIFKIKAVNGITLVTRIK